MRAALFYGPHQLLKLENVPEPKPQRGEVLVKVTACGVCHTDLHYTDHDVPTFMKPPVILGHEVSGIIEEIGDGVTQFKKGDRVLVPPVFTCGECEMCRTGRENVCFHMRMLGNHMNGAYAEYVVAPAKDTIPLPDSIPLAEASVISDAISTPFHALLNRARVRPGDKVGIFGCGGLGLNAVQIAKALGAFVIAVDVKEKKLQFAKQFGADEIVNAGDADSTKQIRKLSGGGVDIAVEAIGNPGVIQTAFSCVRSGGKLVVMGFSEKDILLNAGRIMFREMEIIGTLGCPPYLYPRLVELVRVGKIKVKEVVTHRFPLEKINDAFELLRQGDENLIRAIITL
jgi:6-hydroxycyclohex-1-ene-1-carbonyl-CoA dehydrogenase